VQIARCQSETGSMRKTFMAMGLALSLAGAAAAQHEGPGDPHPRGAVRGPHGPMGDGMLFQGITLTDTQKAQIKDLHEAERATMAANRDRIRAAWDSARTARERGDTVAAREIVQRSRASMEQTRERHIAAVRNILTEEQRSQFDKNVAEVKTRMQQHMREGPGGPRGDRPTMGPGRALFNDITLTDAQKAELAKLHQAERETAQKQREQRLAAVRNILTEEQRAQFDKNVAQLKERGAARGKGNRGFRRGRALQEG
jgi:periplasmic protein CpxP/Spy